MIAFAKENASRWMRIIFALSFSTTPTCNAEDTITNTALTFLSTYCSDCHADGTNEGGFRVEELTTDLSAEKNYFRWVQVFDRVHQKEMPPRDAQQPASEQLSRFSKSLGEALNHFHASRKSTVLRRLNRREYQNTMNDVFGTNLNLEDLLPDEARSHEFDNNGEALGLSMVHLQQYMEACKKVLDAAIAKSTERERPDVITAWYKDTREAEQFISKKWKLLSDGAVVRFNGGGYPTGMLRGSRVNKTGRYRIKLTAYAHQSDKPISFSVGGTSFQKGSEKPIHAFFEARPDEPQTFELEAWIERPYMLAIEPYGIADKDRYQRTTINDYDGPGLAVGKVTLEGPLVDEFPSRGHRLLFDGIERTEILPKNLRDRTKSWYQPKFQIATEQPKIAAKHALLRIANATARRPIDIGDIQPYLSLFNQQLEQGESFEQALRTAVTGWLCSPRFLYFTESLGKLDDHAIAARLSYFLTRTRPDAELMLAAGAGNLSDADGITHQTHRLLSHKHFQRFLDDFTNSWLDLRELDFTAPDQKLFPEFDPFLRDALPRQTRAFIRELIKSNLPIRNLVKSDFAMLNNRLAQHYGLPPVEGVEIRKVTLPSDSVRGGLLSQASILKVTANGTNTSPVTRGAWVMERIRGISPSPPPPGISGIEPDIRGATTLRQQLEKHRDSSDCVACHAKIDPPGFALECFDPIGGFRNHYRSLGQGQHVDVTVGGKTVNYRRGPAVDTSGQFADGRSFADYRQFRDQLADEEAMLAKTFVTKLLTFATGREMGFSDRDEISSIVTAASAKGYRAGDLLIGVVTSQIFRTK